MAIDSGHKQAEPDLDDVLDDLEHRIDRLRVLFEQYFMGIEKIEPRTQRKEVSRRLLELAQKNIRNTGIRYRFNALNQKFSVYQTYWNRTLRSIEAGTYVRDVARAGRDAVRRNVAMPDEVLRTLPERLRKRILADRERMAASLGQDPQHRTRAAPAGPAKLPAPDMEFSEAFDSLFDQLTADAPSSKARPASAPPASAPPEDDEDDLDSAFEYLTSDTERSVPESPVKPVRSEPVPRLPPGMDERAARELHRRFVQAKKLVGDSADLSYEQLVSSLTRQAPSILKQSGAKTVDFSIVIKGDKVILKATPRK